VAKSTDICHMQVIDRKFDISLSSLMLMPHQSFGICGKALYGIIWERLVLPYLASVRARRSVVRTEGTHL
jgi:hypothetical protein